MKIVIEKINKKEVLALCILLILSVPAIYAFFHPGFPKTDDGDWMIIRFSSFYEELRNGQFPVRWLSRLNHGYGYPVANFLYPGFMYLGVPLKVIGFSFVEAVKVLFIGSILSSGVFVYLWLRTHFSYLASLTGALVYLYLPYHLYDATVRGSLGEVLALAVIPFVLWSFEKKYFFLTVIGIALLILSHNTLAFLFLPLILGYEVIRFRRKGLKQLFLLMFLGVGTATFFWFPALTDLSSTVFSHIEVAQPKQYFASISQLGLSVFLVLGACLVLLVTRKEIRKSSLFLHWLGVLVVGLFMSTIVSSLIWELLPSSFVQFPFRIVSQVLLGGAFLSAFLVKELKVNIGVVVVFIMFLLMTNKYYLPTGYDVYEDGFYATNQDTTTVKGEYMPTGVKNVPTQQSETLVSVNNGTVLEQEKKASTITTKVSLKEDGLVTISHLYFPGWVAYIDGTKTSVKAENETGNIQIQVPQGEHSIKATFEETPSRLFANGISLISLILAGFISVRARMKGEKTYA